MTHNKHLLLFLFLASFVLFMNLSCTSVPNRVVHDMRLVIGNTYVTLGSFDEIGAENKLGLDAYIAGDYTAAYKVWKPLAEKGDASAQNNLGHLYLRGVKGVIPQSFVEAMKWYRKAAKQFHASAHFSIGMLYILGMGLTSSDDEVAFKWIRKSAEQGYEYAQYFLGNAYAGGWGEVIPQDDAEAIKWMRKAALQGNQDAQDYLRKKSQGQTVLEHILSKYL